MKNYRILFIILGLLIAANIFIKVSAQSSSNISSANTYSANTNSANTGVKPKPTPTPIEDDEEDEDFAVILKQITQQKNVKFPKNGELRVDVIEEIGEPFTIRFVRDDGTTYMHNDQTVAQFKMKNPYGGYVREYWHSAVDPKVRFQVIQMEGVPSPVIHLAMVQPGGSDYGFWSAMFGEINGKIKLLTPVTAQFSWEGGIQIGDLGKGNGKGIAVWNSIWGDNESHYGAHIYQVDFYHFNKKLGKFVKTKQVKTKQKQESPQKALDSLGLGFYKDAFRDFPEFLEYRENF